MPEAASISVQAFAWAGKTDVLAGEAATDDVDRLEVVCSNVSDIFIARHLGPMLREHGATERVDFHLPLRRQSGAFKAKIKPADASEQRAERHFRPLQSRAVQSAQCLTLRRFRSSTGGVK
jgi:hypothetical protein